ncbi:MAG TPA: DNA-formamidopyrimidine glycosylase family protein, partial [Acidimicrobiales bacterium]|nr:DNA-formamidopyrimidine glycosylase family protein [Acidimicrobiales bacterium]
PARASAIAAIGNNKSVPEGHTIHRLAADQHHLVGRRVRSSSPQGRFSEGATAIDGCTLDAVVAAGKHLFHSYGNVRLHVHLGTTGLFFRTNEPTAAARPQVRLRLDFGWAEVWDLIAPMRCELLDVAGVQAIVSSLGPDPLGPSADPEEVWRRLSKKPRRPVGIALLDQSVIAGVGNVFRTEALAACRIHPSRPAAEVSRQDFNCLWSALTRMMPRAVEEGRIVTVDVAVGSNIAEAEARYVYKQRQCRRCGTAVHSWKLGGRTAHACPACQPD